MNLKKKSTLSAGAGLLDYITFFLLSLFYAVKSFIVIPVHCWMVTSTQWLVCQVDVLWRWTSQMLGVGFVISVLEETPRRGRRNRSTKTKRRRKRKNSDRGERGWDPVYDGRQQLGWKKRRRKREPSVMVILNINNLQSTWHPVLTHNAALKLQLKGTFNSSTKQNQCQNQRIQRVREAVWQTGNMDFIAILC